jgi:hypothetical protein
MAYEIKHFREASYFLLHFDIAPSAIREIERGMLISEEILRHLVTVLEDHGTSISEEDLAPAAVPAGESRTDDGADAMADTDETAAPMAERDDEPVANDADDAAGDEAASAEPASAEPASTEPEPEPATDGDEQTEEAGTAVEA